ncbi:U2-associated SR140 protein [Umbelopsis sp. PMI_123]|nr:U2-associated SR140 protein [Umbelopsis sp. PMI_123]
MNVDNDREDTGSQSGDESPPPRPAKPIAHTKLQAFSLGVHKKTPFQRHKEELEQKKKKESEEAAKVYAEFVASFENDRSSGIGPSFVKSSSSISQDSSSSPSKISKYKPMPFVKSGQTLPTNILPSMEENTKEEEAKAMKASKMQKKRNLDTFLEEIKREQEDREGRLKNARISKMYGDRLDNGSSESGPSLTLQAAFADRPGSHDLGDMTTTNLYLGNISPTINEASLCRDFAIFGPIASVKIMWPRSQEEKERNRNSAFISFMKRSDAEKALKAMDGKELHGHLLRVCWGKAVPIPAQPIFSLERDKGAAPSGLPFNAQITTIGNGVVSKPRSEVQVVKPKDEQQLKLIHRTIERVLTHGEQFEASIIQREWNNPVYRFLVDNNSNEHIYYRWKLYSLLQGDSLYQWRSEPFQMFSEGPWWIPPEVPFDNNGEIEEIANSSDEEQRERQREHIPKGNLGRVAKRRLEIMLRKINFQRGRIAKAMAFAINHADAADEVIDIVCKSLVSEETPLPQKIARLYLVSDILHNSSVHVTNAWKYRSGFEIKLPEVFKHFNKIYRSIQARLKAEQVRRQVSSILSVWNNWIVFPEHRIAEYNSIFMQPGTEINVADVNVDQQGANLAEPKPEIEPVEDVPLEQDTKSVDDEPMDDDIDGEPLSDIDGEPLTDDEEGEDMTNVEEKEDAEIEDMFA